MIFKKQSNQRVVIEDTLKQLHALAYKGVDCSVESVAGATGKSLVAAQRTLDELALAGLVQVDSGRWHLTARGEDYALQVIRAHRLYETYLAHETGAKEVDWHMLADRMEHHLTREEVDKLADRLGRPRFDPHGDPIPTREGDIPSMRGRDLASCDVGFEGKIEHLEDEPDSLYRNILNAGMAPGMRLKVLVIVGNMMTLSLEGREIQLDKSAAANVRVHASEDILTGLENSQRLSDLEHGESARLLGLSAACRGAERRRLLDLGMVPGSTITRELEGPFSSAVAYRVRGTLIALRREQAEQIFITTGKEDAS